MNKSSIVFCVVSLFLLAGCTTSQTANIPINTTPPTVTVTLEPPTPTIIYTPTSLPSNTPIPDISVLRTLFDYDKDILLDMVLDTEEEIGNAVVKTISYIGADGFKVTAYLVVPKRSGTFPAIIYLHKGGASKDQFLEKEAIPLAEMGVVTLLMDSPFNRGLDVYPPTTREGIIRTVIDVQRGVDLLETLPQVDSNRIGYVGHSLGATFGGIVVGVEPRIRAYVLMAGFVQFSEMYEAESTEPIHTIYDLDAIHYIGYSEGAAFLFQYADMDEYITRSDANKYYKAATEPKEIIWYSADHDSLEWKGREDRLIWLSEQLGFTYIE